MTYAYDPELAKLIPHLPETDIRDPQAARMKINAFISGINKNLKFNTLHIENRVIPESLDAPAVPVRIYQPINKPTGESSLAALLYIHGGGFVVGSIDSEHGNAGTLAEQLGIIVVSVEYRLAPEHPYPAALNDCYAALAWLHDNASHFHIDKHRIGVIGVSAGGCLAAALALMCRDRHGPSLCYQFLDIPVLDDRLQTPSMLRFHDTPLWNKPSAELSWQYYLGTWHRKADIPYLAAPARAGDLHHLPPAYISAMEFDPLRDEAIQYASRLLAAGVSVELHCFPGTYHGSSAAMHATISKRQQAEKIHALSKGLKLNAKK